MKIIGKNVLIKPVDASGKSRGGIWYPETAGDSPTRQNQEGIVVAIGSDIKESTPYKKGSRVFIEMYRGKDIELNEIRYILAPQDAIVGISVGDGEFHPVGSKILLKFDKKAQRGGLIIRPSAYEHDAEELIQCTVHLIGNGIQLKDGSIVPFEVKVGDTVMVKSFSGREVDASDGLFMLVEQSHIVAIVE